MITLKLLPSSTLRACPLVSKRFFARTDAVFFIKSFFFFIRPFSVSVVSCLHFFFVASGNQFSSANFSVRENR